MILENLIKFLLNTSDSAHNPVKCRADEWLTILSSDTNQTCLTRMFSQNMMVFHCHHEDTPVHPATSTPNFCTFVLLTKQPAVVWCFILFFFYSAALIVFPSGSCQVDVWSRLVLRAARCLFSLSSQPSNNISLPYKSLEGCVLTAIPQLGA